MFCRILCCFVAKSLFYAIYAVLSRFTRMGVEKIGPKILSVKKKGQIWGMGGRLQYLYNGSCGLWAQVRPLSCARCDNQVTSQATKNLFIKRQFASHPNALLGFLVLHQMQNALFDNSVPHQQPEHQIHWAQHVDLTWVPSLWGSGCSWTLVVPLKNQTFL